MPCSCVSGLGTCPYSYSLIGWWQERLAEVNSGKRIYHRAVALNAFQMMCPWDARLLLSPSPLARNRLCNYRYYWMGLTTKRSCWLVRSVWLHRRSVCPLTLLLGWIFLSSFLCSDSNLLRVSLQQLFVFHITAVLGTAGWFSDEQDRGWNCFFGHIGYREMVEWRDWSQILCLSQYHLCVPNASRSPPQS